MSTYDERIAQIHDEIDQHNAALGLASIKLDIGEIVTSIKEAGAITARTLEGLEVDDLPASTPRLLKKAIVKIAHGTASTSAAPTAAQAPSAPAAPQLAAPQNIVVSLDRPEDMVDDMLLARFDPLSPTNAVGAELARRANGVAFLLFTPDGVLHKPESLDRLKKIQIGRRVTDTVVIGGVTVRARSVGEPWQQVLAAENPLRPGEALADNGAGSSDVCAWTGKDWKGAPTEARQIIRLALEGGEIGSLTKETARIVIDMAHKGVAEVAAAYPNAAARLAELPTAQRPVLEIDLSVSEPTRLRPEVAPRLPFGQR